MCSVNNAANKNRFVLICRYSLLSVAIVVYMISDIYFHLYEGAALSTGFNFVFILTEIAKQIKTNYFRN